LVADIEGGTKTENRMLRRIFGPTRDEVTGEWRKLLNEELNDLYSSLNIVRVINSKRMIWAGHLARMGERRRVYRVLVGKPEGKRPLGRCKCRWEYNIKIGSSGSGMWGCGLDRSGSGYGQVAGTCECDNETSDCSIKCG
jgi:PAS domain-containing protein